MPRTVTQPLLLCNSAPAACRIRGLPGLGPFCFQTNLCPLSSDCVVDRSSDSLRALPLLASHVWATQHLGRSHDDWAVCSRTTTSAYHAPPVRQVPAACLLHRFPHAINLLPISPSRLRTRRVLLQLNANHVCARSYTPPIDVPINP